LNKILRILATGTILYITINLLTPYNGFLRERSIDNQINYLNKLLDQGYDNTLQNRYPEGKVFSNALFALSIIEYAQQSRKPQKKWAQMVDTRINQLISKKARATFVEEMNPPYGAFYTGWVNLVLKSYIESDLFVECASKQKFKDQHTQLTKKIVQVQSDSIRILDTYPGSNWPGDNLVALISISDTQIQENWLKQLYKTSESKFPLIYHVGSRVHEVRGSSQALIIYLIAQYDFKKAEKDNIHFQSNFIDNFLGIEFVKEHLEKNEDADIDSGPVILGYGAAATIMNIKTQASLQQKKAKNTWAFLNMLSCPINIFNGKYYLLKQEPMFDIFMLWAAVEL